MSMRHAILGILRNGPMHGYQITVELERRLGGEPCNSAQIYQGLRWLEGAGLVQAVPPERGFSRDRRPFTITPRGRREFDRWLRSPIVPSRPVRDDALVKLFFLGISDGERLRTLLERLRRQHLRRLAAARPSGTPDGPPTELDEPVVAGLVRAAFRFREEAELRWIDHCLLRLSSLVRVQESTETASCEPARGLPRVRTRP